MAGLQSLSDAEEVWIEVHRLFTLGKLKSAILTDWQAGEVAAQLVDRVWQLGSPKTDGR